MIQDYDLFDVSFEVEFITKKRIIENRASLSHQNHLH